MKNRNSNFHLATILLSGCLIVLVLTQLTGCNLVNLQTESLKDTERALQKEQTKLAKEIENDLEATIDAQQATIDAQAAAPTVESIPTATPDLAATQVAEAVQLTLAAQPATPDAPPPSVAIDTQPPPPPNTEAPVSDLSTLMKSASILLYEDIVNQPQYYRYVKQALDSMGLTYKDNGSAKGWMKNDLLYGGPGGKPWDLVIAAVESRGEFQGEYFEYLSAALNQGSAVIIEAWHLDAISQGKASLMLAPCGVKAYQYVPKTGMPADIIMWPTGIFHPILSEPNSGMRFTNVLDTWLASGDLGSLMALTGTGDAQLLLSSKSNTKDRDGTLAVCMGGKLILQTFSSHSFTQDVMMLLWQNYIQNALKARFSAP